MIHRILLLLFTFAFHAGLSQSDTLSITLENVDYPYTVKFLGLRIDGQDVRMAYMDVAPKENANGRTILLMHGKNFGGYYWTNVIQKLNEAGFRVIAPDQIGFGKSSKPFIHYSFHQLSSNNKKLLDTLGIDKVILLGHSMGGMLATRFSLLYPKRVEKLILENPIGLEDYRAIVPYVSTEQQYHNELKKTKAQIKNYYATSYFKNGWKPAYDRLVTIAAGVINSADYPRYAKVAAMTYQMIYEQPVVHEFPLVKVPVSLIIGILDHTIVGKDKLSKEVQARYGNYAVLGKQTASLIPHADITELNTGHIPHLEDPGAFMNALMKSVGL